ncbi:hypothetical protein EU537_06880 [Candidatus Thorarchaeota archaeon]|nr:MAG: hypothetical protein EU537_06880 [Candidatus Thorarchaeota archaeon]
MGMKPKCKKCGKEFDTQEELEEHIKEHHAEKAKKA